jgi:hypothetical protein
MIETFKTTTFEEWQENLEPDSSTPVITTTAWIELGELKSFIREIEAKNAKGIGIHLIRFSWNKDEPQGNKSGAGAPLGCQWLEAPNDKTQVAIAISGTKNYNVDLQTYVIEAEDLTENGSIRLLMPGAKKDGPTGHNPK